MYYSINTCLSLSEHMYKIYSHLIKEYDDAYINNKCIKLEITIDDIDYKITIKGNFKI